MRMFVTATLPVEKFNEAVRDGTAGEKIGRIIEAIKPECIYFAESAGQRCAYFVVDVAAPSGIPAIAEPWFLTFNATVNFSPAMTPEDLQNAGLEAISQQWG